MLKKSNRSLILSKFFSVDSAYTKGFQLREISRIVKIAPTSVKKYLKELEKENLIIKKKHSSYGYPIYLANKKNNYFKHLKKLYILQQIKETGLLDYLKKKCKPETMVLTDFKKNIEILLFKKQKSLNLSSYESKLNKKIKLIFARDFDELNNKLKNKIINGFILQGYLEAFKPDEKKQENKSEDMKQIGVLEDLDNLGKSEESEFYTSALDLKTPEDL